jgi:hypothetical protein
MPEGLCENAISGSFSAFAELKEQIWQKSKELEILIQ